MEQQQQRNVMLTGTDVMGGSRKEGNEEGIIYEVNEMSVDMLAKNLLGPVNMSEFTAAKFSRVKNNIISALTFLRKNVKKGVDTTKDKNSVDKWKDLIGSTYNEQIVNDGFWLIILKKNADRFKSEKHPWPKKKQLQAVSSVASLGTAHRPYNDLYYEIEGAILDRMACNYHDMFETYNSEETQLLFQIYFDIVAQGVFYSFFYAFPKSRQEFGDSYKQYVFNVFAHLFTDMEISHHSEFIKGYKFVENWRLDLGAGDVLKQSRPCLNELVQKDSEGNENAATNLPPIKKMIPAGNKKSSLKVPSNLSDQLETYLLADHETVSRPQEVQDQESSQAKYDEAHSV